MVQRCRSASRARFTLTTIVAFLLAPTASLATTLSITGFEFLIEVDPAPVYTPTNIAPVEFDVPGIAGRVTFEVGTETSPPPNETAMTYDMRMTVENFGSSSASIQSMTLSGFGNMTTPGVDLQAHSDAPSPVDFIRITRNTDDELVVAFNNVFSNESIAPGQTGFDIYFRFNQAPVALSTFHVEEVNGVAVDPPLAVQRVPEPSFEPIGRWTTHRIAANPPGTGPVVLDKFTSPTDDILNTVRIHSMYVDQVTLGNNPASEPNTDRLEVSIWEETAPNAFGLLHRETVNMGPVTTTFLGNFEANGVGSGTTYPFYEFEIPLYDGYAMDRDTEYWISVQSITDGAYQPVMNWIDADGGHSLDEESTQFNGSFFIRPDDRAFEIEVPEPGLAMGLLFGVAFLGWTRRAGPVGR